MYLTQIFLYIYMVTSLQPALNCIDEIIANNFNDYDQMFTILITGNMSYDSLNLQEDLINRLHKKSTWTLTILKNRVIELDQTIEPLFKARYLVMITEDLKQLEIQFQLYVQSKIFRGKARMLVIFNKEVLDYEETAKDILLYMMNNKMVFALVMIPKNNQDFNLYSLRVYNKAQFCGKNPKLVLEDQCRNGTIDKKLLYLNRHPKQFDNCTFEVITINYPPFVIKKSMLGFELRIMKEIGRALNIFFNYTIEDGKTWGERLTPNNWTGLLQRVFTRSDIAIGNIMVNPDIAEDFILSRAYIFDNLIWIVPVAQPVARWRNIFIIFNVKVWSSIGGYLILTIVLVKLIPKNLNEWQAYKSWSSIFFISLRALIGTPVNVTPNTMSARLFFYYLCIYGFLMSLAYQSTLINYLMNPVYEHQITSVEDIIDENLKIGGIDYYKEFFIDSKDPINKEILQRFRTVRENQLLEDVVRKKDTATIASRYYIEYLLSIRDPLLIDQGSAHIFILNKMICTYPLRIVYPHSFPLREEFDVLLGRMIHTGLIHRWILYHTERYSKEKKASKIVDREKRVLSISNLEGAFLLLFMGYAISFCAFSMEFARFYLISNH